MVVAKEILAETKKKRTRRAKTVPTNKLSGRLIKVLERFRDRWNKKELSEFARQLREFADALEQPQSTSRKKGK